MATAIVTAAVPKTIPPPSSPFAQLLRRSRFASYDPAIRQTYSASPAAAHRGNWGLKRPIALRRKNAFISLTSFESHAHYTEWNNAENQVRFIRRIEEMGTLPRTAYGTPWRKSLGRADTQWVVDSEFCPEEDHTIKLKPEGFTTELAGLGERGPGQYGASRLPPGASERHLVPNINAMSRKEFVRYLRKLRELRPAFKKHIEKTADQNPQIRGQTLYALSQDPTVGHHQRFIEEQTAKEFQDADSPKIAQQPHPTAGLMYSHPSNLETFFTTKPQPGLVLQRYQAYGRYERPTEESFVASYGGLNATLFRRYAGGKAPLLNLGSEQGVDPSRVEESVANLRPSPSGIILEQPPRVVGRQAQGLKAVRIKAEVISDAYHTTFGRSNPYVPGTTAYSALDETPKKAVARDYGVQSRKRFVKTFKPTEKKHVQYSKQVLQSLNSMLTGGNQMGGSDKGL